MFEDSLLESSGRLAHRSPWPTAFSFAVQIAFCGALLLLSLIYTETLPTERLASMLEAPSPPQSAAPPVHIATMPSERTTEIDHDVLRLPARIPNKIAMTPDDGPPPSGAIGTIGDHPGGVPSGTPDGVIKALPATEPTAPRFSTVKVRVSSGVAQGLLVRMLKPQYPVLARQARIEGTVVLEATIGKNGTVQDVHLISGHPMLTAAALDAVRQWLYRPYYFNGEPSEVETLVTVNFRLTNE